MDATPPPGELLGITVHRTDVLHASVKVAHPVVRVSVVDGEGGRLLKKSNPERCVASFYEMGNPTVDYVLPIMTQPCHLQEHWYTSYQAFSDCHYYGIDFVYTHVQSTARMGGMSFAK